MTKLAGFNTQSADDIPIENDERYVQNFAVQMLSQRVFKGVYSERRWFEPLKEFRETVVVNSGETELIRDLCIVKKRLREFYGNKMWIGITDPNCVGAPAGYCLFVKTWNQPLGEHDFLIKKVKFSENEMCLFVKSKRFIDVNPSAPNLIKPTSNNENHGFMQNIDGDEFFDFNKIHKNCIYLLNNAYSLCTFHNLTTVLSFLFVLIVSLFKFSTAAIKWLGEFTIRFMHESSNLLRAIMPFLLAVVELLQKTIGGFYILLAMMWRTWTGGNNQPVAAGNPPPYCIYPSRNYPPISRRPMPRGQMNYQGFYGQRR